MATPVTSRTLTFGGSTYPLILPNIRDPRLHVAAVIITIHVLGQVGLHFQVSVPQILAAILTCAIIEVVLTFRQTRSFVWPASAMLTGSGVALILRVVGTPADDPWNTYAWYVFAGVAGFSLLTKYVIRYRGSHVFNPSNIGLVVAFVVLGSSRRRAARLLVGAAQRLDDRGLRRDHRRRPADHPAAASPRPGGDVLGRPGGRRRAPRRLGPLHDRELGVRAGLRRRLLAGDRHLARGADLPVLHDHGPQDRAGRAGRAGRVRPPRRGREHAPDGAADRRVRDQGRPARGPGRRVRRSPDPRPARCPSRARRRTTSAGSRPGSRPAATPAPGSRRAASGSGSSSPSCPRRRGRHRRRRDAGSRARRPGHGRGAGPACHTRSIRRRSRRSPSTRTSPTGTTRSPGPGAQAILLTLAENLELENQALLRGDGAILTAVDHGDRLIEMQASAAGRDRDAGRRSIARYRFDARGRVADRAVRRADRR